MLPIMSFGGNEQVEVASEADLREALQRLPELRDGQSVVFRRSANDYIKATRCGHLWSASTRRGGIWTWRGFDAALTSEYSEREVREARQTRNIWTRLFGATPSERALSTGQVQHLFLAYFTGAKYDIPFAGPRTG